MSLVYRLGLVIIAASSIVSCGLSQRTSSNNTINPVDFGILQAQTAVERYDILYKCHLYARDNGKKVSYRGVKHLFLEVPRNAKPIPLSSMTDFAGVTIEVLNNSKSLYLFQLTQSLSPLDVPGQSIDNGFFKGIPEIENGDYLLVIKDETPWVSNRIGYNYGAERRDIMKIHNGQGKNRVVCSYQTPHSRPKCFYCKITGGGIVFKNLIFIRNSNSSEITYLLKIENQTDVLVSNVTVRTPNVGEKYGDVAITLSNVFGLTLRDIIISETYSQKNKYGYGVSLNNIYDLTVERMKGHPNWGVFGTNNLNKVFLKDCDINRFDVHCYGKDITFDSCIFTGLYNQFSSIYGNVVFRDCTFFQFTPVLIEPSYNAYTPFNIMWKECVFYLDSEHSCLINLMGLSSDINNRQEIKRKCVPNIQITDCIVNVPDALKTWCIIETGRVDYSESLDYIDIIEVSGLTIHGGTSEMRMFSKDVKTTNRVLLSKKRVSVLDAK